MKESLGPGQCFAPQMGSSVCEHQCGSWQGLRKNEEGGGWADCNGTCSDSNYPWTLAAAEDPLGPRVVFIYNQTQAGWLVTRNRPPCSSRFTCSETSE